MEVIPEANDPIRVRLIEQLSKDTGRGYVDKTTHALVWLSDISQLEWMMDTSTSRLFEIQEILGIYNGLLLRDRIQDCKYCHTRRKVDRSTDVLSPRLPTVGTKARQKMNCSGLVGRNLWGGVSLFLNHLYPMTSSQPSTLRVDHRTKQFLIWVVCPLK
ncbi:hypothetical protein N7508_000462 [Penicillium antarcticum]|uniref:uncharacterized protein n=1 Tax=Penicillium antarcticum TaxID=416450 RepID=UPI00239281FE|nr:uncharacterized protein N7508_000462 [Penicillium antarcticum]KAJ5320179.1 hypothetical protein N7508_000462 [Penicillium antarcticum]